MELSKFCACMDQIAPRTLALDFDNVGLLVEPDHNKKKKMKEKGYGCFIPVVFKT